MIKKKVYLAGKVGLDSTKWRLAKTVPDWEQIFVSSDMDGPSNHGEYDHSCGMATSLIESSDHLIAILDTPSSYGTIAEIAWASAKGKTSYVITICEEFNWKNNHNTQPPTDDYGETYEESMDYRMSDTYAFVCCLPNVTRINVSDEYDARSVLSNVVSLESPIEHMFLLSWYEGGWRNRSLSQSIYAQTQVGPYRVDFAIKDKRSGKVVAVELDGHDYHSSKEQRQYDAKRDRYLLSQNINVIRFTGSEVFGNPRSCVDEVYKYAMAAFHAN